jgi:23S rRNA (guanosine2251-2'-O)-methyltransferase
MATTKYQQIFGLHAVRHVFEHDISRVVELWVQQGRNDERLNRLITQAQQQGLVAQSVPRKTLDQITGEGHHQGIVIRCKIQPIFNRANEGVQSFITTLEEYMASLTVTPFLLVLDGIQDPHNLGACLRTAEAAGVQAVIIPKNRACALSPTVYKVASGAAEVLPLIQVSNLATTLRWLKTQGIWLIGATETAETSLFNAKLTGPLALILGAEGTGLRRLTQAHCDSLVHIPMFGKVESLNISVATGICLYEAVRQRL